MEYRRIQNSDLCLPVLGTGCWAFGGGEYWGNQDQKDATDVVRASLSCGITYFDTAEVYNEGRSESSLGMALKGIPRDKILIGTKISPSNTSPGIMEKHCEASLRRLNTGYIDIYMIHWPVHPHSIRHFTNDEQVTSHPPAMENVIEGMLKLQRAGKIRYIGVSNFSAVRLKKDFPPGTVITVNELPYNLLCRAIEFETLPFCCSSGIGVIGYMTLFQGILSGKYGSLDQVPSWQRRTRHFNSDHSPLSRHGESGFETETTTALKAISGIAAKTGIRMADLAVRWAISSGIHCALTGARSAKQLEENARGSEMIIDPGIINELNEATALLKENMGNNLDYYESKENDRTL